MPPAGFRGGVRLAALMSGGKDSAYAAHLASSSGHDIACIVGALPESGENMVYHHPNAQHVALHAEAMGVPLVSFAAPAADGDALALALAEAVREHDIDGVVHGGISSAFQRDTFAAAAKSAGIQAIAPLWGHGGVAHLRALLAAQFRFVIVAVSAGGLGAEWLGVEVTDGAVHRLGRLAEEFGFDASFEGGEAETFVTECPLFARAIEIRGATATWDGYRGRFEIEDAALRAPCSTR